MVTWSERYHVNSGTSEQLTHMLCTNPSAMSKEWKGWELQFSTSGNFKPGSKTTEKPSAACARAVEQIKRKTASMV
jgi:hypothetical protein